jgi:hypothetical protein
MILIGMLIAGILVVHLVSSFLEWAVFRRVVKSAPVGIPLSIAAAAALGFLLSGFVNAGGGPWNPLPGGVFYLVAGAIVWALKLPSYRRRAEAAQADEALEETFK